MPLTNYPNGLTSMGVPVFGPGGQNNAYNGVPFGQQGVPLTNGNYWFVDSATGSDGFAGTANAPLATLSRALALSVANNGDVIVLCPQHAETISAAGGINVNVAGVSIVGLGNGRKRPVFTFATSTAATMTITAANVTLANIVGTTSIDQIVSPFVVSAADANLSIEWQDGANNLEALRAVLTTSAANRLRLNLLYNGFTNGTHCVNAVRLVGGTGAQVNVNYYGILTTAVVEFFTTAVVDAQVTGWFYVSGVTNFSKDVVDTITGSTWSVQGFDGAAGVYFSGSSGLAVASASQASVVTQQETAVQTSAAIISNGLTLFTIANGPVEIMELLSICQTANNATASTLQYSSSGTLGATTQTISGASAALTSATAGTSVILQGTALSTAPLVSANAANIVAVNGSIVVPAGSITAVVGVGSTTGTWKHFIRYKPLAPGATVTAAF